jgi:hypothetical protein
MLSLEIIGFFQHPTTSDCYFATGLKAGFYINHLNMSLQRLGIFSNDFKKEIQDHPV